MTFNRWLIQQRKREDPIGDLARDVKADRTFRRTAPERLPGNTFAQWHGYLYAAGACTAALEALEEAWDEYEYHHV